MKSFSPHNAVAIVISLFTIFVVSGVASADYSVQIGAFRDVAPSFGRGASEIGEIYREETAAGLTRVRIGRYATRSEAAAARSALIEAGYEGAFVVRKDTFELAADAEAADPASALPHVSAPPPDFARDPAPAQNPSDPLASVPEELRDRVVILDGRLSIIDGEDFVPLDEYLANSY